MSPFYSQSRFGLAASALALLLAAGPAPAAESGLGQPAPSVVRETPPDSRSVPAARITRDQFLGDLTRELTAHFNLEGDLQLELPRTWTPPAQLAGHWMVEIAEYPSLAASSMFVRCRISGDGVSAADTSLLLRATHNNQVWVVRQPIAPGTVFDPASLDTRRVDLFRERESLPTSSGDSNFVFTRSVPTGRLLTWRDLARRPLVRKGDLIEVSATEGQLIITMKALAMESGAKGDVVTVRNPVSRKDFVAVVTHENRVQVRF